MLHHDHQLAWAAHVLGALLMIAGLAWAAAVMRRDDVARSIG
jgi:hypothetical protein